MCIGVRFSGMHAERSVAEGVFLIRLCEDWWSGLSSVLLFDGFAFIVHNPFFFGAMVGFVLCYRYIFFSVPT